MLVFCAEVIEGVILGIFLFFLKNNFLGKKCYFLCSGGDLVKINFLVPFAVTIDGKEYIIKKGGQISGSYTDS